MRYRRLGRTGLQVSEIGFGAEWMGKPQEEVDAFVRACEETGINLMDVWMADPAMRSKLGHAMAERGTRDQWIIQGHIGSTWQDGQYVRTRDMEKVRPAFEDLLARLETDHVELGMIHYVDDVDEFRGIMEGPFIEYVRHLHAAGTIEHVGLSTHNPDVAALAASCGEVEMIMFSVNPAFDTLPASNDIEVLFGDYDNDYEGMNPARAEELNALCEREDVGLTVMKGFAGGRLFDAARSPFGVALTPVQCIHYALTRPAVASILAGFSEAFPHRRRGALRDGDRRREGLCQRAGLRASPCLFRPMHVLRALRPLRGRHRHSHSEQVLRFGCHAGRSAGFGAGTLPCAFRARRRLRGVPCVRNALPVRRVHRRAHGAGRYVVRVAPRQAGLGGGRRDGFGGIARRCGGEARTAPQARWRRAGPGGPSPPGRRPDRDAAFKAGLRRTAPSCTRAFGRRGRSGSSGPSGTPPPAGPRA